ncbi:hypothetical protein SMACR_08938 [Sordaria macrospora]|uniref:WGS project CABT00000000 data, contig 2.70 n=2 Tax=Sordaria macrospora TaxID=5147 RepID=F7WB61_SORMK|nr:uncharacterized protein SMAC_08938 [Sordaria macrospora k-hell]KAA8631096.1 hypothetical protein SMACR_08938 [Sordaria macrospora]KAH7629325.1 hypothetical protein B0T09DRAFT_265454 [Sordaria sp. MPI-SDFR-AT-0083]WPJ63931.1 hypothetical protein SMAC4_08938 [Sordaria macrospora]CCC14353.1 unnamed protein product [Sordaria macrospora k-hell]
MARGESVVAVIDIAPESTIRAVLKALCAEEALMVRIANMLAKIPLDVESKDDQPAEQSGSGHTYAPVYAPAQGHWGASVHILGPDPKYHSPTPGYHTIINHKIGLLTSKYLIPNNRYTKYSITTAGEASNIEICIQCDEPFELGDESETCQHHPYDMELDEFDPSWSEMPISPWDIQDNEFCRSMNPRGFVYPCCYKRGSQSQRAKFPGEDDASSNVEDEEDNEEDDEEDDNGEEDEETEVGEAVHNKQKVQQVRGNWGNLNRHMVNPPQ